MIMENPLAEAAERMNVRIKKLSERKSIPYVNGASVLNSIREYMQEMQKINSDNKLILVAIAPLMGFSESLAEQMLNDPGDGAIIWVPANEVGSGEKEGGS